MPSSKRRVVLLVSTTSYRTEEFLRAAQEANAEIILAHDRCQKLARLWPDATLDVKFHQPERAAEKIVQAIAKRSVRAILPTDEQTAYVAALASKELGLPSNPPEAAWATRDKYTARVRLQAAGLLQPAFRLIRDSDSGSVGYPCVLKPRHLSASRGVIRANSPAEFAAARKRICAILNEPEVRAKGGELAGSILVESFVDGPEVALEAVLTRGQLEGLALFDKPDPLMGPYFEETIYVTPSRLSLDQQHAVAQTAQAAAKALGLDHGPVHAELRLSPKGPVLLEIAARTIGGLCARTLRFGSGMSLEELLLRHALGDPVATQREKLARGVMMLPIPRAGIFQGISGQAQACAVSGVESLEITARLGDRVVPLPEGGPHYLGFLFAHGEDPLQVEQALRAAHACLGVNITPTL